MFWRQVFPPSLSISLESSLELHSILFRLIHPLSHKREMCPFSGSKSLSILLRESLEINATSCVWAASRWQDTNFCSTFRCENGNKTDTSKTASRLGLFVVGADIYVTVVTLLWQQISFNFCVCIFSPEHQYWARSSHSTRAWGQLSLRCGPGQTCWLPC